MSPSPDAAEAAPLPDDVATLQALLLAERATAAALAGQNERLRAIVKELQRALFGGGSEKAAQPDQLQLALENLEQAIAEGKAEVERTDRVQRRHARDSVVSIAARCQSTCRGMSSSSSPRSRPALAVAARCTGSARTSPSGSTASRRSSG